MGKYKFNKIEILHIVTLAVIYLTWAISVTVYPHYKNIDQNIYSTLTFLLGSVLGLIYTILLHYPLLSIISKRVNPRIEAQIVKIRRLYAFECLYTILLGFYAMNILVVLKHPMVLTNKMLGFGLLELASGVTMFLFTIFTIVYIDKYRKIVYLDKLQQKNADIS